MKQMPFPDTNYGKQNKQKQTLKPIIIRTLMQTRWTEVRAYQIPEVITKLRTIFHPLVCFVFVYLAKWAHGFILAMMVWLTKEKKRNGITVSSELGFSCCYDQWHSSLLLLSLAFHFIHLGYEYLAYIFHMQLVDGSCPEQEHADKFSQHLLPIQTISLPRHNLWSQFYAVQFDFSSHSQMFRSHIVIRWRSLPFSKSTFASPGMPTTPGPFRAPS